jgi:hypothetical protein
MGRNASHESRIAIIDSRKGLMEHLIGLFSPVQPRVRLRFVGEYFVVDILVLFVFALELVLLLEGLVERGVVEGLGAFSLAEKDIA